MGVDDAVHDGESQPEPAVVAGSVAVATPERLGQGVDEGVVESGAAVGLRARRGKCVLGARIVNPHQPGQFDP